MKEEVPPWQVCVLRVLAEREIPPPIEDSKSSFLSLSAQSPPPACAKLKSIQKSKTRILNQTNQPINQNYLISSDRDQINPDIRITCSKDVFFGKVVCRYHLGENVKAWTSESVKVWKNGWPTHCVGIKSKEQNQQSEWFTCGWVSRTLSLRILVLSLLPEGGRYPTILGSDIIKTRQSLNHKPLEKIILDTKKNITFLPADCLSPSHPCSGNI